MRALPAILLIIGTTCVIFSYWGLNTTAGHNAYDEMAGIIPLAAAPVGLVFIALAGGVWWLQRRRH